MFERRRILPASRTSPRLSVKLESQRNSTPVTQKRIRLSVTPSPLWVIEHLLNLNTLQLFILQNLTLSSKRTCWLSSWKKRDAEIAAKPAILRVDASYLFFLSIEKRASVHG